MARRPLHLRRKSAALVGLLVLLGLFELNQWLPGGWPGGGGDGGFRVTERSRPDPTRLRPPLGPPPTWPEEGFAVTVRAPGGAAVEDWTLERRADGFAINGPDERSLEHGPAGTVPWTVHLPETPTEAPAAREAALEVVALAAEDGRPLPGVSVAWEGWGGEGEGETDAQGRFRAPAEAARLRVRLEAPDRFGARRWVDPRQGPATFTLAPRAVGAVRFTDAETGEAVAVDHLRLLDAEGTVQWDEATLLGAAGPRDRFDLDRIPDASDLSGAVLEVGAPGRPVVRVPLADAPDRLPLPRGRAFRIRALGEDASKVRVRRVQAHYRPPGFAFPEVQDVVRTFAADEPVVLPDGVGAALLVESGASAPRKIVVAPDAPGGSLEVRHPVGARLGVRVLAAEDDHPLSGADVVVVATVEGLNLERRRATDDQGTAAFAELPRGWVEVYAHAPGRAWAADTLELGPRSGEATLRLEPASALQLIVETASGLPLEGVRVHAEPSGGGRGEVLPPGAVPLRTAADGTVVLEDLRDRPYRVRLSRPGYRTQVLEAVRPGPGVHFVTLVED